MSIKRPILRSLAVFVFAGLSSLSIGQQTAAADGVGVYPTDVRFENTVRGGEYYVTVGVLQQGAVARTFRFEISGHVGPWLSFADMRDRSKPLDAVTVPPDSEERVLMHLRVPGDAANGVYKGSVMVVSSGTDRLDLKGGAGASVGVGAEIPVEVTVIGDQKVAGSLIDIHTSNVEVGYPLRVMTMVQNLGNVRINPEVRLTVATEATVIGEVITSEGTVYPNEAGELEAKWDTSKTMPGKYSAKVAVNLGGLAMGSRELPFEILPRGTLTRQGALDAMLLASKPVPGYVTKVLVKFRNTGQIDSRALFAGELYQDSMLVDSVVSVEKLVPMGESTTLEVFVKILRPGSYTLRGKVNFEGKESEVSDLTFEVSRGVSLLSLGGWTLLGLGAFLFIMVSGLLRLGLRLRRQGT